MKKLLVKISILTFIVAICIIFIQSCCKESYKISSKVVHSGVWTLVNNGRLQVDTVKSNFIISTDFEVKVSGLGRNFIGINSAYATTCKKTFLNYLVPQSFTLTINKPFLYNNDTVNTNENLIKLPNVIPQIYAEFGGAEVRFPQEFINNAKFQPGYYKFTINGMTTDSIKLTNSIQVYINLGI